MPPSPRRGVEPPPHGGLAEHGLVLDANAALVSWPSLRCFFMRGLGLDDVRGDPNLGFAGRWG